MATPNSPRRLEAYELEDLHGHRFSELNELAGRVMNRLGVPRELRGIRESGPHAINRTGEPFTFETVQGGRNSKPGRQSQLEEGGQFRVEKRGINVDAAVLDDGFFASECWRNASIEERIEAVVAHELAEYQSPGAIIHGGMRMQSCDPIAIRIFPKWRGRLLPTRCGMPLQGMTHRLLVLLQPRFGMC